TCASREPNFKSGELGGVCEAWSGAYVSSGVVGLVDPLAAFTSTVGSFASLLNSRRRPPAFFERSFATRSLTSPRETSMVADAGRMGQSGLPWSGPQDSSHGAVSHGRLRR